MRYLIVRLLLVCTSFVWAFASIGFAADDSFFLREGDRVALVGDAFFENELKSCYLETMLTAAFPRTNATFRNFGWSGDDVRGSARARFGPPAEGFQHLKEDVLAFKPTVLLICYGMNESFAGEAGLPAFSAGYRALLDAIVPQAGRVVLITPIRHQKLPPPLPDPSEHNHSLKLYIESIQKIAVQRGYRFVDLFNAPETSSADLTTDGVHPTKPGYFAAATAIGRSLGLSFDPGAVDFGAGKPTPDDQDLHAGPRDSKPGAVVFRIKTSMPFLPFRALDPRLGGDGSRKIESVRANREAIASVDPASLGLKVKFDQAATNKNVKQLAFAARIDGIEVSRLRVDAQGFVQFPIAHGDVERVEKLRGAIVAKNELDFHRRRPENETYLFLFRKHEQGQNAREIPMFDPLVEAKEKEIAELRVPLHHTYELIVKESGR